MKLKWGDKLNIYQEKLLDSINMLIEESLRRLKLDYTITGKIVSYDSTNKIYTVLYNGDEIQIKAREGLTLNTNDIVYIRVVQGNFSEKFIDCKKP